MTSRQISLAVIFVGPLACAADQLASYALVQRAATRGGGPATTPLTIVAAALISIALFIGWLTFRRETQHRADHESVDSFLAALGIASNLFFLFVVVVGFGIPHWFLRPTD